MQNYSDAVEKHVFDHCNVSPRPHVGGGGQWSNMVSVRRRDARELDRTELYQPD
jgi:hypothetical protein